jgi:hypothetical protein
VAATATESARESPSRAAGFESMHAVAAMPQIAAAIAAL